MRGKSARNQSIEIARQTDLSSALRSAGVGEVDDDARRRAEYSSDASNYRMVPQAVVFPRSSDDVEATLAVARDRGVPITSRGGGTSTAGNSAGAGIVLDFSKHLNHVISVDPETMTAIAQPGAILDHISAAAAPHGLRYGPDPSTHARATIGGSIGNNACGAHALYYGRTSDNIIELDVVVADGSPLKASRFGRAGLPMNEPLLSGLDGLIRDNLSLARTQFGQFGRQVSAYSLEHLLPENGADLAKFLVGTEGTLVIVTSATVRLVNSPNSVALAVLGYQDMPAATEAAPARACLQQGPAPDGCASTTTIGLTA